MRTFIAIEIPEPLKLNLDRSIERLRNDLEDGLIRWVRLESTHLTLKFLGEIERAQVPAISEALDGVAERFSSFRLEITGFGCFPNTRRPRVLWVGFRPAGGELQRLQAALASRLEKIGFDPEPRGYHPHLTLGRVRKGLSRSDMELVSGWAREAQIGTVGRFEAGAISLIRSVLQPDGAVYSSLHVARLAA
jgi:2'-5' RNA ligase